MKIWKIADKSKKFLRPPDQFDEILKKVIDTYSKNDGDRAIYQMVIDKFQHRSTIPLEEIVKDIAETTLRLWKKMSDESKGDPWYKVHERQACHDVLSLLKQSGYIFDFHLLKGITY